MQKIWLDITNSPHVIFYNPIIQKLKARGYEVVVTAREYAQTKGLLELFEIEHHMIGRHRGKSKLKKLMGLFERSNTLYKFGKDKNFDAAVSMGSQDLMIAARRLKIPHMTLFDYEYSFGHHISFRLSRFILSPAGVPEKVLKKFGAKDKVVFYPGLKEQFYIGYYLDLYNKKYDAKHNPITQVLDVDEKRVIIVMRPEATQAHYQTNKNTLSFDLLEYLDNHEKNPVIIVLPRVESQKQEYVAKGYKNVIIPEKVINGIDLVASCDLVIGAGGTINREAAAVGTPVYTIFQGGQMCAVDTMLIATKRMVNIQDKNDFDKIIIEKKKAVPQCQGEDNSEIYLEMVERLINERNK
ncbi:MAG: DUF354 domain-containing protein [Bacillota bacterium]